MYFYLKNDLKKKKIQTHNEKNEKLYRTSEVARKLIMKI